jgi:SHS2 domain-containing protein
MYTTMDDRFEEVEHPADVAIRVWGSDLAELFANAAYGLACQLTDPAGVEQIVEQAVELEAYDVETLLVTWLGELLFLGERDDVVFVDFCLLDVTPTHLRGVARGGAAGGHRRHVKAVTFSDLEIVRSGDRYETTIVFDV